MTPRRYSKPAYKRFATADLIVIRRGNLLRSRTPSELRLEAELQGRGIDYEPQCPAEGFFVDIRLHPGKLGIEVDGGYHNNRRQEYNDRHKMMVLKTAGWRIIRFTNEQVCFNISRVMEIIEAERKRYDEPRVWTEEKLRNAGRIGANETK